MLSYAINYVGWIWFQVFSCTQALSCNAFVFSGLLECEVFFPFFQNFLDRKNNIQT
jgi:hypothetical protein